MLTRLLNSLSSIRPVVRQGSSATSTIELDYPVEPRRRPIETTLGGQQIARTIATSEHHSLQLLQAVLGFHADLARIPASHPADNVSPFWANAWIPPLDAMSIYALVRTLKPATYFEVGSGTSTKFARRAITDGYLDTRIVSVDPYPRAEIDGICDEVIRSRFEDLPASDYQSRIRPGDIVFVDNSHRSFQSTDVTVFFTEMLPALPAGTTWGLHDIFLPFDYPEEWLGRFYNEQYLLAAYLLGGHLNDEMMFSSAFSSQIPAIAEVLQQALALPAIAGLNTSGGCFWMRRLGPKSD